MAENNLIVDAVIEKTIKDGDKIKLPCAAALQIAGLYSVSPKEIGDICNERGIRIIHCQLGCFQ